MKKNLAGMIGFLLLFGFDRWTKMLAYHHLQNAGSLPVIGDILVLQYLENRGAAFGILQDQRVLLIILTLAILVFLVFVWIKIPPSPRYHILRALVIMLTAGAAGNMWDRVFRGYVIDFIYVQLIDFPIFNIADCYVVVSTILTGLLMLFYYRDDLDLL